MKTRYHSKISKARMYDVCHRFTNENLTIRSAAAIANVSKSSLHKYIHEELPQDDVDAYKDCLSQIEVNLSERANRGGLATKQRWERMKAKND